MSRVKSSPRTAPPAVSGGRPPSRSRGDGREAVTAAARENFAERGFHGTSIRDIAKGAGLSLSALYYWYSGKEELLAALIEEANQDYHERCETALAAAGDDPIRRLSALVRVTIEFRTERQVDSKIGADEARYLTPEHNASLLGQARMATRQWAAVIDDGVSRGVFRCEYPEDARRTIIAACNAIAQWYDPSGALAAADLVDRYTDIALRVVDAKR